MAGVGIKFGEWFETAQRQHAGIPRIPEGIELPAVLAQGEVSVVYQPIVTLPDLKIFAYEALVRSTSPHWTTPPRLFEEAIKSRCCGALGRVIRQMAVQHCPGIPLFLNIHPAEFDESWLVQPDDPIFTHDDEIYLEITESVPLTHFAFCHSVLSEIRHKGIRLAVDDLGAGYSNLKYIAELQPDIVKLDRNLIVDLASNERLVLLFSHMVRLCEDLGAKVVAEGIESAAELQGVIRAGVHYAQGYYLARPSFPAPAIKVI